jgi:hypothetical protein
LRAGDIVLVKKGRYAPYAAKIVQIYSPSELRVLSLDDTNYQPVVSASSIQPHRPIQQGDVVLIPPDEDDDDDDGWVSSEVLLVSPFGYVDCLVRGGRDEDDDDDVVETLDMAETILDGRHLPPFRLASAGRSKR